MYITRINNSVECDDDDDDDDDALYFYSRDSCIFC
jgi:hypothetical protein